MREPVSAHALAALPTHEAASEGWDTVFAVPYEAVNAEIVAKNTSPPNMAYQSTAANKLAMTADFGPWQVIAEGDGEMVRLALPMTMVVGSFTNMQTGQPEHFTCADCTGVIEICLDLIPHDPSVKLTDAKGKPLPAAPAGTTRNLLVTNTKGDGKGRDAATFVGMKFTAPLVGTTSTLAVETAFTQWCQTNLDQFSHIFAVLDLNDQIDTGAWAFCKPHTSSYACIDTVDKTSGLLGILCMTSNDPVPANQQLTNFAIPAGCQAGFLVSSRRFLLDLVLPSLVNTWPNLTASDLEISADNLILSLKSGIAVDLPDIAEDDGTKHTPSLTAFSMQIILDILRIDMHTDVEVSAGIHATCTATYWYRIKLGSNNSGQQTLVYEQSQPPVIVHGHYSDSGIVILKEALQVIAVVLGILSIFISGTAGMIICGVVVMALVGDYIMNKVEDAHKNDAPAIAAFKDNFTAPIIWTGSAHLDLKSAQMASSLQLGGDWKG